MAYYTPPPHQAERFHHDLVKRLHRAMEEYLAVEIDEQYADAALHALRAILLPARER